MKSSDPRYFDSAESHGFVQPGTAAWGTRRQQGIGGSEIASVVGLSPWDSPYSLWHRKRHNGGVWEKRESEPMMWGTRVEPLIADRYKELHPGTRVLTAPLYTSLAHPWQIASPDRILVDGTDRSILEIKTARFDDHWRDGVPLHYKTQITWYMNILNVERTVVAVLIGGSELREYEVMYDPQDGKALFEEGQRFWDSVINGIEPAVDGHPATWKAVRATSHRTDGSDTQIPPALAHVYAEAVRRSKAAERQLSEARSRVVQAIGAGKRAVCGKEVIATRTLRDGKTYSLTPGKDAVSFRLTG